MFYKIRNNNAPSYLCDCLLPFERNENAYYSYGCRVLNVLHTRLRHRSSNLNADLFRVNLINDPGCVCGWIIEDAIHFFLVLFIC
jgi:hypothetical protein